MNSVPAIASGRAGQTLRAVGLLRPLDGCPVCGKDSCDDDRHLQPSSPCLPVEALEDAVDVSAEGLRIAAEGILYRLAAMIPLYGMLGFLIAYAKVGKTTFGQAMAAAIAMGRPFLGKATTRCRVLVVCAEDPPEYVAWLAQHLQVERGWLAFYRRPIILDLKGLAQLVGTVQRENFGLVLVASWQAVVRGLIRDENDNAGAVQVVENVKAAARLSGIPWLIDAHSGKAEDQGDDADPSRAMRGASAAAGAADYALFLRYADGAFGTQRKLSGKGRFVSFAPITMDFDPATGTYTEVGVTTKNAAAETTWRLLLEASALTTEPRTTTEIARAAGLNGDGKVTNTHRRQIVAALKGRSDVGIEQTVRFGEKTTLYKLLQVTPQ